MPCIINSILVVAVGTTIAWLFAAFLYASDDWHLPILPCCILFVIAYRGFKNRPKIKSHCGWTILFGCLLGLILSPSIQTTGRLSIDDELLGFYDPFGSTNAALIGAAAMLTIFAVWECVSDADRSTEYNTEPGTDE